MMARCHHCGGVILAEPFCEPYGFGQRSTCLGCARETEVIAPESRQVIPAEYAERIAAIDRGWLHAAQHGTCANGHERATHTVIRFAYGRRFLHCARCAEERTERDVERARAYRQRDGVAS